jgi:hypothetical protein
MTGTTTAAATRTATTSVVVAMLTYRRPERLATALPLLVAQASEPRAERVHVVVVDNDPAGGAADAVRSHDRDAVTYVHEARPGIAAARNAALAAAVARGADAIVFIDDDETPAPGWLSALIAAWRRWGCAAVAGPADRVFESELSDWVVRSGFFSRTRRPTGLVVPGASTNNLLLDLATLQGEGLEFDERFGLTGGSDTMLTRSLTQAGHQIRWCDEAEVRDAIPADRATREWVLRRSFRTGTTWSRVHLALRARRPGPRLLRQVRVALERLDLTVRGVVRIGTACPVLLLARLVPARASAGPAAECAAAGGAGMLLGAWGIAYTEYGRTP